MTRAAPSNRIQQHVNFVPINQRSARPVAKVPVSTWRLSWWCAVAGLSLFMVAGCRSPIGTDPAALQAEQRQAERSALNSDHYSEATRQILNRYQQLGAFTRTPRETLCTLQERALKDTRRDLLFALAELHFLQGERLVRNASANAPRESRAAFLTAAVYAYHFLFRDGSDPLPTAYDGRFKVASDIYNRGLARGLADRDNGAALALAEGERALADGSLAIGLDLSHFPVAAKDIAAYTATDLLRVRGLDARDEQPGLGVPLAVTLETSARPGEPRLIPATAFLRLPQSLGDWHNSPVRATLEVHPAFNPEQVEVGGRMVPLRSDATAVLAYALADKTVWRLGREQFFSARERVKTGLYPIEPYQAGRIPVVFVHGTFSSPVHWAQTWNTLRADAQLRERLQFWCFVYNSGNPVSDSAARLRETIVAKVRELDPEQKDPALQHLVVIGHSQGGLLAKLTGTETGEALWRTVSEQPLDELQLAPEVKASLRRNFVYHPLACVDRIIFVATPHRGSYLASGFVRGLARKLVTAPEALITAPGNWLQVREQLKLPPQIEAAVPTSIDGMSPKNPWLMALAELPTAPGVQAHSIIAVKPGQVVPAGSDGVVDYQSATVSYAASEHVTRGVHSCQGQPDVIEEIRRILLTHLSAVFPETWQATAVHN